MFLLLANIKVLHMLMNPVSGINKGIVIVILKCVYPQLKMATTKISIHFCSKLQFFGRSSKIFTLFKTF